MPTVERHAIEHHVLLTWDEVVISTDRQSASWLRASGKTSTISRCARQSQNNRAKSRLGCYETQEYQSKRPQSSLICDVYCYTNSPSTVVIILVIWRGRESTTAALLDHIDVLGVPRIVIGSTDPIARTRTIRLLLCVKVAVHFGIQLLLRLPGPSITSGALAPLPASVSASFSASPSPAATLTAAARPSSALATSARSGAARSARPIAIDVVPASRTTVIVGASRRERARPVGGHCDTVGQRTAGHNCAVERVSAGWGSGGQEGQMDGLAF